MNYDIREILNKAKKYLEGLNVDSEEVEHILKKENFECALAMKLPGVCILKENRAPGSRSKQYHIHCTGESMKMFYSQNEINNSIKSTEDERIEIKLIHENLLAMQQRYNNIKGNNLDNEKFDVVEGKYVLSSTVKKIAVRKDLSKQVQLSKLKYDGNAFHKLRTYLFTADILIFFKYRASNTYLLLGIPSEDSDGINFSKGATKFSEIVKKDLDTNNLGENKATNERKLKKVTAETIAETIFSYDDDDDEFSNLVDYSDAKKKLRYRTERHQQIVKKLAKYLEACGFTIYESAIDCLAIRGDDVLIFEIKTVDSSEVDERKQVRTALAQLCFYEEFRMANYKGVEPVKIAVFERKIEEKYVDFLKKYDIETFWYIGDQLSSSKTGLDILNSFISK